MNAFPNHWHAVIRCSGCGAPLPIAEPFEAISCQFCGNERGLHAASIGRLRHHFEALKRYRRVATEARWHHEDLNGTLPAKRFSPAFFAVMGVIAATATVASLIRPNGAVIFIFVAFVLVVGPARFVVWKIESWNLAGRRAALGLEAIPMAALGWANCGNCGGQVRVGDAIPACLFCSADLVASASTKAVVRSVAKKHAAHRVERALDSRGRLLDGQRAAALDGAKSQFGFFAIWGGLIGTVVGFGLLQKFAGLPSWLAFAVAAGVALGVAVLYFRAARSGHRRKLNAWHDQQVTSGRPVELQRELERVDARPGQPPAPNRQSRL